ncbi:MAG: TraR/DksA family transcriptional regulator [Chitinophagales bacterium]|nr:TraR/DksA family transcriptional regulator [Chitinophagales bacterium]
MHYSKLEYFKQKLINEKQNLLTMLSNSQKNINIDNDGDEVDEIQANQIQGIDSQISKRATQKLNLISIALDKIDNEGYGNCEDCGEEISEKRLDFNPCFSTCVLCAEEREFENRQKGIR